MHNPKPDSRTARFLFVATLAGSLALVGLVGLFPAGEAQSGVHLLAAPSMATSPIHHLEFGTVGDVRDDCFYADMQPPGPMPRAPTRNDLRLTNCRSATAFSLVGDPDSEELGYPQGAGNTAPNVRVAYADVNNNGYRDGGDYLYLTTGAEPQLEASGDGRVTIRLTSGGGKAAGSLVYAGDWDQVSYGNVAPSTSGSWAWNDQDGTGAFGPADALYFLPGIEPGYPAGNPIPNNAIWIRGAPRPADPDGATIKDASRPAAPLHWLEFGAADSVQDDCFYAELTNTTGKAPSAGDLRLTSCQGYGAFTMVSSADSTEVAYPIGSGNRLPWVRVAYADINANGAYDSGDDVYFTTANAPNLAVSGPNDFTLRIKSGGQAIGTLVKAGDVDHTSYGQAAPTLVASLAWTDDDKNSALTAGDSVFLLPGIEAGYAAGNPVPSNAVRLRQGSPPPSPTYHIDCFSACTTTYTTSPATTPTTTIVARPMVRVEAGSVAFDQMVGAVGERVMVYGRIVNPSATDADLTLHIRIVYQNSSFAHDSLQDVFVAAGGVQVFRDAWTPDRAGHYAVFAQVQANDETAKALPLASGADGGDKAIFWVGPSPPSAPLMMVSGEADDSGVMSENARRKIPIDVTAYNVRATNVRLDVYTISQGSARSLTPATTIEAGDTVRFYLEVQSEDLPDDRSNASIVIELRALSDHGSSNVDTLDLVVRSEAPRSIPALGPELAAVGLATAGALAACFRRRD